MADHVFVQVGSREGRADLATACNGVTFHGTFAPVRLTPDSSSAALYAWLRWNDRNGEYYDNGSAIDAWMMIQSLWMETPDDFEFYTDNAVRNGRGVK